MLAINAATNELSSSAYRSRWYLVLRNKVNDSQSMK